MDKKQYITPGIDIKHLKVECLMGVRVSGSSAKGTVPGDNDPSSTPGIGGSGSGGMNAAKRQGNGLNGLNGFNWEF